MVRVSHVVCTQRKQTRACPKHHCACPPSPVEMAARAASPREAGLHGDVAPVPFLATEGNTRAVPRLVDSLAYKKRHTLLFSLFRNCESTGRGLQRVRFPSGKRQKGHLNLDSLVETPTSQRVERPGHWRRSPCAGIERGMYAEEPSGLSTAPEAAISLWE